MYNRTVSTCSPFVFFSLLSILTLVSMPWNLNEGRLGGDFVSEKLHIQCPIYKKYFHCPFGILWEVHEIVLNLSYPGR